MATTASIKLTQEQRNELANALRVKPEQIPHEIGIVAVSPESGKLMGLPEDMQARFSPALIIT
jgi:hypothetical protein